MYLVAYCCSSRQHFELMGTYNYCQLLYSLVGNVAMAHGTCCCCCLLLLQQLLVAVAATSCCRCSRGWCFRKKPTVPRFVLWEIRRSGGAWKFGHARVERSLDCFHAVVAIASAQVCPRLVSPQGFEPCSDSELPFVHIHKCFLLPAAGGWSHNKVSSLAQVTSTVPYVRTYKCFLVSGSYSVRTGTETGSNMGSDGKVPCNRTGSRTDTT